MPNPENTHIAVITIDNNVNCFEVKDNRISIYTITDDKECFVPVPPSKLMLNLGSQRDKIDRLLDNLQEYHNEASSKVLDPLFCLS